MVGVALVIISILKKKTTTEKLIFENNLFSGEKSNLFDLIQ